MKSEIVRKGHYFVLGPKAKLKQVVSLIFRFMLTIVLSRTSIHWNTPFTQHTLLIVRWTMHLSTWINQYHLLWQEMVFNEPSGFPPLKPYFLKRLFLRSSSKSLNSIEYRRGGPKHLKRSVHPCFQVNPAALCEFRSWSAMLFTILPASPPPLRVWLRPSFRIWIRLDTNRMVHIQLAEGEGGGVTTREPTEANARGSLGPKIGRPLRPKLGGPRRLTLGSLWDQRSRGPTLGE